MSINFDEMDVVALQQAREMIESTLSKRKREQVGQVYQQILDVVKNNGLTLQEVLDYAEKKGKKAASTPSKRQVPAKYRHPEDANLTWSGRGKQPKWVQEQLDQGVTLSDLAISS